MIPPTLCPTPEALRRMTDGLSPTVEATDLRRHLTECPSCLAATDRMRQPGQEPGAFPVLGRAPPAPLFPASEDPTRVMPPQAQIPTTADRPAGAGGSACPPRPPATVFGAVPPPAPADQGTGDEATASGLWPLLLPPEAPDELGRLGGYRILECLGQGAMGVVFRADDPRLQREVALKVMLPTLAADPAARARFLREARAVAAITSDHIVTIHQVGEAQGVPYLVMPLLRGESLEVRLRRNPQMGLPQVLALGRDVALGLAVAHAQGLIHRDVKPANLWLEAAGDRIKILDFGLVLPLGDRRRLTALGALMGTPAYMAPEQALGGLIDARADLASLGCVLYQAATGVLPFDRPSLLTTLQAVGFHTPPDPRQYAPGLPPELAALLLQLLAKDPARRPASAAAVAQTFRAMAKRQPALRPATAVPGVSSLRARPRLGNRSPRDRANHPTKAFQVALVVAVALIGALIGYLCRMRPN